MTVNLLLRNTEYRTADMQQPVHGWNETGTDKRNHYVPPFATRKCVKTQYKPQIDLDNEQSFLTFRNVYNGPSAKGKRLKPIQRLYVLVGDHCLL
jgi:hypothetical protein